MKIILVTHNFYPERNALANRALEHAEMWSRKGHEVTIITSAPNMPDGVVFPGYRNAFLKRQDLDGIRVVRVGTFITPNKGVVKRGISHASFMLMSVVAGLFTAKADVVIASSPQMLTAVGGYFYSRLKRCPYVLEIRDLWPDSIEATEAPLNKVFYRCLERLEKALYRRSDLIVAVTDSSAELIKKRCGEPGKVSVVTGGVLPDKIKVFDDTERRKLKEKYGLKDKFVVSYIGTIGMAHALENVLYAAELMREKEDIVFLLVGSGAEKDRLIRQKRKKSLDNVVFLPLQDQEAVSELYGLTDISLVSLKAHPTFTMALPSKMFEIMAAERMMLLCASGESKKVMEEARCGFHVLPEDPKALSHAVMRYYNDPEERVNLGRAGGAYVRKNFARTEKAEDFLRLLERIGEAK